MSNPLPSLTPEEYAALRDSIAERGQLEPIIVSGGPACEGEIGDGHHRQQVCSELGVAPRVERRPFDTEADFRLYQLDTNLKRRHLTVAQRIELGMAREPWEREQAKERQREHGGTAPNTPGRATRSVSLAPARAREKTAEAVGLKPSTYERGAKVLREAPPEIAEKLRAGDLTVNAAYLKARNHEREVEKAKVVEQLQSKAPPPAAGPFDVVVLDPPWRYEKRAQDETHRARLGYPDMSIEEIDGFGRDHLLPRLSDSAIVWLWTTNAFMGDAYRLADNWQLQVRTILTWAKDRMGTGDWLRGQTEHCLLCTRGRPVVRLTNQTTLLHGPLREHSRKPDEFYALVEALCPGTKLELFGRQQRAGWTVEGAESERFVA